MAHCIVVPEIVEQVKRDDKGKSPYRPEIKSMEGLSPDVVKLMTSCWEEKPSDRPTFQRIKSLFRAINGGR